MLNSAYYKLIGKKFSDNQTDQPVIVSIHPADTPKKVIKVEYYLSSEPDTFRVDYFVDLLEYSEWLLDKTSESFIFCNSTMVDYKEFDIFYRREIF